MLFQKFLFVDWGRVGVCGLFPGPHCCSPCRSTCVSMIFQLIFQLIGLNLFPFVSTYSRLIV